jgi:hypothetical protein
MSSFIDLLNYPLYVFFELPFINKIQEISILFVFNILIFFLSVLIICRNLSNNITLIVFILFFSFFYKDNINYIIDNSFDLEKSFYVKTLNKFKDTELNNNKYSDEFLQNFFETPYYKIIDSEIHKPSLNKSVINELHIFNNFRKESKENYFIDKDSFNKFKDEHLLDNNPEFYLIYRQVYEDKVLTQVEKEKFLKTLKK